MVDNGALFAVAIPEINGQEGCRLLAYQDQFGVWTVGWGDTGPGIVAGTRWTQAQANDALLARLNGFCAQLDAGIPWWRGLGLPRQAVLLSMIYQMGDAGLMAFHRTLTAVEDGQYVQASEFMLQSAWANQTPTRAKALSQQMATGAIQ